MKKNCKIIRNTLTLLLAVTIMAGGSSLPASAAARAGCSHPFTQILLNDSTTEKQHDVSIYSEVEKRYKFVTCTITTFCSWKELYCPKCNRIIGIYDKTCTEKHSVVHF